MITVFWGKSQKCYKITLFCGLNKTKNKCTKNIELHAWKKLNFIINFMSKKWFKKKPSGFPTCSLIYTCYSFYFDCIFKYCLLKYYIIFCLFYYLFPQNVKGKALLGKDLYSESGRVSTSMNIFNEFRNTLYSKILQGGVPIVAQW